RIDLVKIIVDRVSSTRIDLRDRYEAQPARGWSALDDAPLIPIELDIALRCSRRNPTMSNRDRLGKTNVENRRNVIFTRKLAGRPAVMPVFLDQREGRQVHGEPSATSVECQGRVRYRAWA